MPGLSRARKQATFVALFFAAIVLPVSTLRAGQGDDKRAPTSGRHAILIPITVPTINPLVPPSGGGFIPRDCPPVNVTNTDASFTGGSYIMEAGMAEGEIAAASYTVPAADFPMKFGVGEIIFATQNASQNTVTQWSVLIWQGTPNTGTVVAEEISDDVILPFIRMGPGTNGVDVQFSVDPGDFD